MQQAVNAGILKELKINGKRQALILKKVHRPLAALRFGMNIPGKPRILPLPTIKPFKALRAAEKTALCSAGSQAAARLISQLPWLLTFSTEI